MKRFWSQLEEAFEAQSALAADSGDVSALKKMVEDWQLLVARSATLKKRYFYRIRRLARTHCPEQEKPLMHALMPHFSAYDIEHEYVKNAKQFDSLADISSFKACVALRSRRKLLAGPESCPEWVIDSKVRTFRFADVLGVRRPWQNDPVPFDQLVLQPDVVVKPSAGGAARGVYLLHQDGTAFDVNRSSKLDSWEDAKASMAEDIAKKRVTAPSWIVEQLVSHSSRAGGIARDYKFLCFYGKAMLARGIDRYPETVDRWWDRDGEPVNTGQRLNKERLLEADAPPAEYFELAESISQKIPAPFMRIDFVEGDEGLLLNEFTPRPGSYGKFTAEWDQKLGDAFLSAEARLDADLLKGKRFPEIARFLTDGGE